MYCNACNSSPECKRASTNTNVGSQCNKLFYNESCFNYHLVNNRCTEYSCRCDTCKKVINSKERPMMEHICGELHCRNCKRYVLHPHECFMQRKQLNPTSEKYMFYDFETYLDENKKHVWTMQFFKISMETNGLSITYMTSMFIYLKRKTKITHWLLTMPKDMTFSLSWTGWLEEVSNLIL